MPLIMVMLSFTLQIFRFNLTLNQFQIQTPLRLNIFDADEMDHLMEFFYSEHDEDLLDVDLHILQD